jgi:hypothetical protein
MGMESTRRYTEGLLRILEEQREFVALQYSSFAQLMESSQAGMASARSESQTRVIIEEVISTIEQRQTNTSRMLLTDGKEEIAELRNQMSTMSQNMGTLMSLQHQLADPKPQ